MINSQKKKNRRKNLQTKKFFINFIKFLLIFKLQLLRWGKSQKLGLL